MDVQRSGGAARSAAMCRVVTIHCIRPQAACPARRNTACGTQGALCVRHSGNCSERNERCRRRQHADGTIATRTIARPSSAAAAAATPTAPCGDADTARPPPYRNATMPSRPLSVRRWTGSPVLASLAVGVGSHPHPGGQRWALRHCGNGWRRTGGPGCRTCAWARSSRRHWAWPWVPAPPASPWMGAASWTLGSCASSPSSPSRPHPGRRGGCRRGVSHCACENPKKP